MVDALVAYINAANSDLIAVGGALVMIAGLTWCAKAMSRALRD